MEVGGTRQGKCFRRRSPTTRSLCCLLTLITWFVRSIAAVCRHRWGKGRDGGRNRAPAGLRRRQGESCARPRTHHRPPAPAHPKDGDAARGAYQCTPAAGIDVLTKGDSSGPGKTGENVDTREGTASASVAPADLSLVQSLSPTKQF